MNLNGPETLKSNVVHKAESGLPARRLWLSKINPNYLSVTGDKYFTA